LASRAILDDSICRKRAYINLDAVGEIIGYVRQLASRGYWSEQKSFELSNGDDPSGVHVFDMRPTPVHNELGRRREIETVPEWPMGVTLLQYCAVENEWGDFAEVHDLFVSMAQAVLRTQEGVYAYLTGSPLYLNTLGLNLPAGQGPGVADEFVFPMDSFPYLTPVLGMQDIDLCGSNVTEMVDQAAGQAFEMADAFRNEPSEPSAWISGAIDGVSCHSIPVTPEVVEVREGWQSWRSASEKARVVRIEAAPDMPRAKNRRMRQARRF
jgi:hypothetical protein